ncbi:glycosyltransferase family 4 protein [Aquibacillus kalidii]|uniref:glycosyltransferase family 4 protein n=1 Tax=Aquibacillus kalidii TaxID=2762597 RepID=UPI001644200F|nr:glycosyltransferase family 4 protein [Aquibacillus kalidii]
MKLVLATPNFHQPRGNTVTVQRIANGLEKLGVDTEIISITDDSLHTLPDADLLHGFHAYRFYKFLNKLNKKSKSYVITLTGTDLNHNLFDPDTRNDVLACLKNAEAIHVFNEEAKQIIEAEAKEVLPKLFFLPQGASQFNIVDYRVSKEANTFLFVLPAGIRKVKNIPFAIELLKELYQKNNKIRLWLIGPIIEDVEGKQVTALVEKNKEWVKYLGQVPHDEMGLVYHQADCVLNTSVTEGQPSTVIEAMGHGLPVLVSDNHGNTSIVSHQKTGWIYSTANQFLDCAEQIVNNIELRQSIGKHAKQYIAEHHSSEHEAEFLLSVYQRILKELDASK